MSVLKMFLGFVLGVFACAILLALISIRSPIIADLETLATKKVAQVSTVVEGECEQKVNIEVSDTQEGEIEPDVKAKDISEDLVVEIDDAVEDSIDPAQLKVEGGGAEIPQAPKSEPKIAPKEAETIISEASQPKIIKPVPATVLKRVGNTLTLGGGGVRLPSVSATSEEADTIEGVTVGQASMFEDNSNPLITLDTPFLSIVLVDIGSGGVSQADLLKQTLPLSFAVDGSRSDAGRVSSDYRAVSFEVVSLLNSIEVEELSTPKDAANAVQSYLAAMPQALAVVDAPGAALQKNRRFLDFVLTPIAKDAPGFLTYKGGLNTASKAALDAGVPTGAITR